MTVLEAFCFANFVPPFSKEGIMHDAGRWWFPCTYYYSYYLFKEGIGWVEVEEHWADHYSLGPDLKDLPVTRNTLLYLPDSVVERISEYIEE